MSEIRFNQAVATAGKITFIYDFAVLNKQDIAVFLQPFGQPISDENNRLTLDIDYKVEGVGENAGGQIVLLPPLIANDGDLITLIGQRKAQPPAEFQAGQLSAQELNAAFAGLTVLIEDIKTQIFRQMLSYEASNLFAPENEQVKLPILDPNFAWVGTINNGIVTVELPDSVDAGILRAQLADDGAGQDGARIVGYENIVFTPNSTTVHAALAQLQSKVQVLEQPGTSLSINENIILGGDFSINPFQEGTSFTPFSNDRSYVADGWLIDQKGTLQVTTDKGTDFPTISGDGAKTLYLSSMEITILVQQAVLNATDQLVFEQLIEGNLFRPMADTEEITVSFWVKSPLTGIYCVSLRNGGKDRFIVREYTINSSNVWQKIVLDFEKSPQAGTWDYENGVGLILGFTLAAGSDLETPTTDIWQVGDEISTANQVNFAGEAVNSKMFFVDIELSNKSSLPLPERNAQQELTFAQRHFEKSYNQGVNPGTISLEGVANFQSGEFGASELTGLTTPFKTEKRFLPVITWYSPDTGAIDRIRNLNFGELIVTETQTNGTTSTGYPKVTTIPIDHINRGHWTADARFPL